MFGLCFPPVKFSAQDLNSAFAELQQTVIRVPRRRNDEHSSDNAGLIKINFTYYAVLSIKT